MPEIAGKYGCKIMIVDEQGTITRVIGLPYPGKIYNISDMPDAEWDGFHLRLHEFEVEMEADPAAPGKKRPKMDARGLPLVRKRVI